MTETVAAAGTPKIPAPGPNGEQVRIGRPAIAESGLPGDDGRRGPLEVYDPTVLRVYEDLVRSRNVVIYGEIVPATAARVVQELQWLDSRSKKPIDIWLMSPGGELFSSFAIFDAIRCLRSPTRTIGIGYVASGAGLVLQSGQERLLTSRAWLMIHEITNVFSDASTSKAEDELNLLRRLQAKMIDIYTERSTLKREDVETQWRRKDWWLDAKECVRLKLVDSVVGEIRPRRIVASTRKRRK